MYPMLVRRGLPQLPVCTSFAYGSDLSNVSVRELSALGVRAVPEDGLFGHMSTYSVDMCVIVLITHVAQGHYSCCSYWLLCGLGVGIRGVQVYSVMSQAIERLLLIREQLECIPACIKREKSTPLISEHTHLFLIVVTACTYLMY